MFRIKHINKLTQLKYFLSFWLILMLFVFIQIEYVLNTAFKIQFILIPTFLSVMFTYYAIRQKDLIIEIKNKQQDFASIVEMAEEISYLQRIDGSYKYISSSVQGITGYEVDSFYKTPNLFCSLVNAKDKKKWLEYEKKTIQGEALEPIVVRIKTKEGVTLWLRHQLLPVYKNNKFTYLRSTNAEITKQRIHSLKLQHLALNDSLTNLINRHGLNIQASQMLKQNIPFSIIMMDLDRFKVINDSLGHSVGDLVLKKIAKRLKSVLPQKGIISRFGGDEFIILLPMTKNDSQVENMIQLFLNTVEEPIVEQGFKLHVSASFGWVSAPEDGSDVETLIRLADTAMYMAKGKKGASFFRYSKQANHNHQHLLIMETNLRKAIKKETISPYFQPLINTKTGRIEGVECLARWHDKTLGWVSPDEFISLAETANLIGKLGLSILEKSIRVASELYQTTNHKDIYFSVNVSPYQLSEINFIDKVRSLLTKYQLPSRLLKLEVTESLFIGEDFQADQVLRELKESGIKILLDDFGTGYSAFSILRDSPIDVLKIDRSFIKDISENEQHYNLVTEIIKMAHILKLTVVAEGIETDKQRHLLLNAECDTLQGYLLGKPMPKDKLFHFIEQNKQQLNTENAT